MYLIPTNLKSLADICTPKPGVKYAEHGVHLSVGEGKYCACATDGRILLAVEGERPDMTTRDIPESIVGITSDKSEATIPGKAWKKVMTEADRLGTHVAVAMTEETTGFACQGRDRQMFEQVKNAAGNFP